MANSEYSFSSRLLHRLALQSEMVSEMSFDAENAFVKKIGKEFDEQPVLITGLARAGTTMLMRYIYESGEFRSLTYLDMPFVMMPSIWKKISGKKIDSGLKERAHNDGIMVGFDSPEAFEEIFWRTFAGKQYIKNSNLTTHKVDSELIGKYRQFIHNAILSSSEPQQTRYLSKNNNNILRIDALKRAFPQAHIIIPFRHPLEHALSLKQQHEHFSKVQLGDKFSLDYMRWLGHFEFGLDQRPFYLEENDFYKRLIQTPKSTLDYWLLSWINYYDYALRLEIPQILFCSYESFCTQPAELLQKLFGILKITASPNSTKPFVPSAKQVDGYDPNLLEECLERYTLLTARFHKWADQN